MTVAPVSSRTAAPANAPVTAPVPPRLRLESGDPRRTLLDGGWWPRSTDPVAELPALVLAIDAVHGPITRLVLSADGWADHPRRLAVGGRVLRLGYFASQPVALLTAMTDGGARVDLLVVPPDANPGVAAAAMGVAARPANRVPAQHILLMAGPPATPVTVPSMRSEEVWETDGGSPRALPPGGLSAAPTGI
jgi:hypothetical protein